MNNNLSSGKVISVSNVDQPNNQIITNSQIVNGQIIANPSNNSSQSVITNGQNAIRNSNITVIPNLANNSNQPKGVIERGASWSYNETRALLSLWGQDMVQRQLTNSKRTRHVWEKIAEKLGELGYSRTPDQVR